MLNGTLAVGVTRRVHAETRKWINDVESEGPGSLAFVCGVLRLDAQATAASLREIAGSTSKRYDVKTSRRRNVETFGSLWRSRAMRIP